MLGWGYTMREVFLDMDSGEGYQSTSVRHDFRRCRGTRSGGKFNFSLDALKSSSNTLYAISTACSLFRDPVTPAMTRWRPLWYSVSCTPI
jgi:hypothetical protein